MASIPGPSGLPVIGVAHRLRRDPLGFSLDTASRYGDVSSLKIGAQSLILVNHPDLVEQVLSSNHAGYRKSDYYRRLRPLFGEGMIAADGENWRTQRSAASHAFSGDMLRRLVDVSVVRTLEMAERWRHAGRLGTPVDIADEFMRLTLDILTRVLFQTKLPDHEVRRLNHAITVLLRGVERRIWAVLPVSSVIPTPENRAFHQALHVVDEFVYGLIRSHRNSGSEQTLLHHMLAARCPATGVRYDDRSLRDQIVFMIIAGHETTASALAWTMYLLAAHPPIADRLHRELRATLGERDPSFDDVRALRYARQVFEEAMRLFPPAWTISRTATQDDEIAGHRVKSGTSIMLSPYVLHRNPNTWSRPDEFDPDRFEREPSTKRPRFAYFPFGGGPRVCLGMTFATLEALAVIAIVAGRFRLRPAEGETVVPQAMISLRPRGRLLMHVATA